MSTSKLKKDKEGSLPPINKFESQPMEKIDSYSFKKNLLSQHHYDHINAFKEKTMIKKGLGKKIYLPSEEQSNRAEMNSREYISRILMNDQNQDEQSQRKMLESSRTLVNSKMSEEEYAQEVVRLATHQGLDIERSNALILVKNRLDQEMYKKLANYKASTRLKQYKSNLEQATRAGSMDLVREIEQKMVQQCRQQEQRIKFEHQEEFELKLLQAKRDQAHENEKSHQSRRQFKNQVRNEQMVEMDTQTEFSHFQQHQLGLGINMYNAVFDKRVVDLELHNVLSSILISICESQLTKDKVKDHIIRLFGGITRPVLDSMQEEITYMNQKLEEVKVERAKLNSSLIKTNLELEKSIESFKNLQYNQNNLKEGKANVEEPFDKMKTQVSSMESKQRTNIERHRINHQTKQTSLEDKVKNSSVIIDKSLSSQYENLILNNNLSASGDEDRTRDMDTTLCLQTIRVIMMQTFSTEQKLNSITKIIDRLNPFFNMQYTFDRVISCESNQCTILVQDLIGQQERYLTIFNSADVIENYLFNFESHIIQTLAKVCPKVVSCELQGVDLASKINYRITDTRGGKPLNQIISELSIDLSSIEIELFETIFEFNLEEIDSEQVSEQFLHELIQKISRNIKISVDHYVYFKELVWKVLKVMMNFLTDDQNSDNSSVGEGQMQADVLEKEMRSAEEMERGMQKLPKTTTEPGEVADTPTEEMTNNINNKKNMMSSDGQDDEELEGMDNIESNPSPTKGELEQNVDNAEEGESRVKFGEVNESKTSVDLMFRNSNEMPKRKIALNSTEFETIRLKSTKMYTTHYQTHQNEQEDEEQVSRLNYQELARKVLNKRKINDLNSFLTILKSFANPKNSSHYFNPLYNLSAQQREVIDGFIKSNSEAVSKMESIMVKVVENQDKRILVSELYLKEVTGLLVHCHNLNISNIVVSTRKSFFGATQVGFDDHDLEQQFKLPYWKLSINDNLNNTLLSSEAKIHDLKKINEIEKVPTQGEFEIDQEEKQLPDQFDFNKKQSGLNDSKYIRELVTLCKILRDLLPDVRIMNLSYNDLLNQSTKARLKCIMLYILQGFESVAQGKKDEVTFTLDIFKNMVNDKNFLAYSPSEPLIQMFKRMGQKLYFSRFEGVTDLIDDIKQNIDHSFSYRDTYVNLPQKGLLSQNLLSSRMETEYLKATWKGHIFLMQKFKASFEKQEDALQSLLQHIIPKEIYRKRYIFKFVDIRLVEYHNSSNQYKIEKFVRGPPSNQINVKTMDKTSTDFQAINTMTRLFYGACTFFSDLEKNGQVPSITRDISFWIQINLEFRKSFMVDISSMPFRNQFHYYDVQYTQELNQNPDQALYSTALSICKIIYYTFNVERLSDFINLLQMEDKNRTHIRLRDLVQSQFDQNQRDNIYHFVIIALFGRQLSKLGCLVDYQNLLSCWDEYAMDLKDHKLREKKKSKERTTFTDKIKLLVTQESNGYFNTQDEDELKAKDMQGEELTTVIASRKSQTAFDLKSQTGIEFKPLRTTPPEKISAALAKDTKGPKFFIDNQNIELIKAMCIKKQWDRVNIKQIATCDEVIKMPKIICIGEHETGRSAFIQRITRGQVDSIYKKTSQPTSSKFVSLQKGCEINLEFIDMPSDNTENLLRKHQGGVDYIIFFQNPNTNTNILNLNKWLEILNSKVSKPTPAIIVQSRCDIKAEEAATEGSQEYAVDAVNYKDVYMPSKSPIVLKTQNFHLSAVTDDDIQPMLADLLDTFYPAALKDLEILFNQIINGDEESEVKDDD